jgi:hypothetical protein
MAFFDMDMQDRAPSFGGLSVKALSIAACRLSWFFCWSSDEIGKIGAEVAVINLEIGLNAR